MPLLDMDLLETIRILQDQNDLTIVMDSPEDSQYNACITFDGGEEFLQMSEILPV